MLAHILEPTHSYQYTHTHACKHYKLTNTIATEQEGNAPNIPNVRIRGLLFLLRPTWPPVLLVQHIGLGQIWVKLCSHEVNASWEGRYVE